MTITKRGLLATMLLLLGTALWWLAPIYGFYAHKEGLPLPPTGWHNLPDQAPASHYVHNQLEADAGQRAEDILATHRKHINAPAMTAAVMRDGELVWAGVSGWADLAKGQAATTETAFRIGSTSKIITATVLARLVARGTVDLDLPIETYWSPLPNPKWKRMTLRHLASHMSGLPHYKRNTDWGIYHTIALNTHYADVRDAVTLFDETELLYEPGSTFYYSTLGTVLLGAVLSQATQTSYRDLVKHEVYQPIGLTRIAVAPTSAERTADLATSYYERDGRFRRWRPVDLSHRLPGGGFVATSKNLVALGNAWLDENYISTEIRDQFWQPQKLESGEVNEQNYALGFRWNERTLDNGKIIRHANHGGVSRGAQSWLMIIPEERMVIAFNTNRKTSVFGDFGKIYRELYETFTKSK